MQSVILMAWKVLMCGHAVLLLNLGAPWEQRFIFVTQSLAQDPIHWRSPGNVVQPLNQMGFSNWPEKIKIIRAGCFPSVQLFKGVLWSGNYTPLDFRECVGYSWSSFGFKEKRISWWEEHGLLAEHIQMSNLTSQVLWPWISFLFCWDLNIFFTCTVVGMSITQV